GQIVFPRGEGHNRGRAVFGDRVFDALEIRQALFPVIPVARHLDVFVGLELDEFKWSGADRMAAHVARADMTWVDRRQCRRKDGNKRRLRSLQMEGDLVVAVDGDLFEVAVPGLARVDAKLLARLAG